MTHLKHSKFKTNNVEFNLISFMRDEIITQRKQGHYRRSETYLSAMNSLKHFADEKHIIIKTINSNIIIEYEDYLRRKGISANTSSFYMRNLRAIYNKAVDKNLIQQEYPFKRVYTGIGKTIKRALQIDEIRRIKEINLEYDENLRFARDMFMFAFYTRGMSFVDMAYLEKRNLQHDVLSYRRKKTDQLLVIHWEKCMQQIIDKYNNSASKYLLPIINNCNNIENERKQYIQMSAKINRYLKHIGDLLSISIPLTMYVARHTWASIAKSKHIPISIISDALGHDSESTTLIYISSLDNQRIDNANRKILRMFKK